MPPQGPARHPFRARICHARSMDDLARRPAGRGRPPAATARPGGRMTGPEPTGMPAPSTTNASSFRERVGALRNLWPFLAMVWATSPSLTSATILLRLVRALLPVATLYIGKLIIDDVVMLVQLLDKPATLQQWLDSGYLTKLGVLLAVEFTVAVLADILGRI
eukprot:gene804-1061_t